MPVALRWMATPTPPLPNSPDFPTMPKKILFESAVHQFLWAGRRLRERLQARARPAEASTLADWLQALELINPGPGALLVRWSTPAPGEITLSLKSAKFYTRGDADAHARRQNDNGQLFSPDQTMVGNRAVFDQALHDVLQTANLFPTDQLNTMFDSPASGSESDQARKLAEERFHDEWAASEDLTKINVRHRNEAPTAPEMRHIRRALGNLHGKTLLDIGCGLGEASVYFALEGAQVTASDISPGMCAATERLAELNGTSLETHVAAAEDMGLGDRQFDIIYTGNTLHHADTAAMMRTLLPHLKDDGVFVSWDPLAYNPAINLYRAIAGEVHTEDEHPLRTADIRTITSHFETHDTAWYWLTSNLVFIVMVLTKITHFRQVRLWKAVIDESPRWTWLYTPLAALDRLLIKVIPILRLWCWNVVIIARRPRRG